MATTWTIMLFAAVVMCVASPSGVSAQSSTSSTTPATTTTASTSSGTIMMPPMLTLSPSSQTFRPGSSVQMTCAATGTPTPTYTWTFNGAILVLNQSNIIQQSGGSFTINSAASGNVGAYQCSASNVYGTAVSNTSYLQLATLGSFSGQTTPYTAVAQPGTSKELTCNGAPTSNPAATFAWSIVQSMTSTTGTVVPLSSRVQVGLNGGLYFANVLTTDASSNPNMYSCNLHNSVLDTTVGGSYTSLVVTGSNAANSAPSLAYSTSAPVSFLVGQTFTLYCFFYGNPTPTLTWSVLNGALPNGRYTINNYNTQLTITDAQASDAATYVCGATNSAGSATIQLAVTINAAPAFLANDGSGPSNVNATNGDTAEFDCATTVTGQIVWYQNGNSLNPNQLPSGYSLSTDLTVLTVSDVCKTCSGGTSDLAVIQCNVSNSYGFAYGQAYLNVLDATVFLSGPSNQTLPSGDSTTLTCQFSSDASTPVNVTWYLNDQEIQSTFNTLTSSYYLTDVAPSNQGIYTCYATNDYSNASYSVGIIVLPPIVASVGDYWYVFLIIGLIILIVLIVIFAFYYRRHNVGESYPVDEVEKENGNDPVKDLQAADFHDYQRPEGKTVAPMSSAPQASMGATPYDDSVDGGSVNYSNEADANRFNENASFAGQYYQPNVAPPVESMTSQSDAMIGAPPKRIQLTGGGPQYYNAADADLDAAFDDESVAASQQQQQLQHLPPQRRLPSPGHAGSMPMLLDNGAAVWQPQMTLDGQRRRIGGSAPMLADEAWRMEPREFPASLSFADVTLNGGRVPPAGAAAAVSQPAAGYRGNVDAWIDDESETGETNDFGRPMPPPRPGFSYTHQASARSPVSAADDVFPVMFDADGRNYDNDRRQQFRPDAFAGPSSPHSLARSPSESSV